MKLICIQLHASIVESLSYSEILLYLQYMRYKNCNFATYNYSEHILIPNPYLYHYILCRKNVISDYSIKIKRHISHKSRWNLNTLINFRVFLTQLLTSFSVRYLRTNRISVIENGAFNGLAKIKEMYSIALYLY